VSTRDNFQTNINEKSFLFCDLALNQPNKAITYHEKLITPPGVNFINILRTNFLYESALLSFFFYLHVTREKLPKRLSYKKGTHKMLMKLTPESHSKKGQKARFFLRFKCFKSAIFIKTVLKRI